jgi:hypothetical protein
MGGLRGQKLVILDGCYTAAELYTLKIPPRTNIIGHTEKGYEGEVGSMRQTVPDPDSANQGSPEGSLPIMGFFTRAIVRELQRNTRRVDVARLVAALQEDRRILGRGIGIGHRANTVIVLESVVWYLSDDQKPLELLAPPKPEEK